MAENRKHSSMSNQNSCELIRVPASFEKGVCVFVCAGAHVKHVVKEE